MLRPAVQAELPLMGALDDPVTPGANAFPAARIRKDTPASRTGFEVSGFHGVLTQRCFASLRVIRLPLRDSHPLPIVLFVLPKGAQLSAA
jgi:hypothetical protein